MPPPQFTLRLNVNDEQNTDLARLVFDARRLVRELGLEAVEFEFLDITYIVTKNSVIQKIDSEITTHLADWAIAGLEKLR